jgi:two-component system, NarL family, invasion response regulator UvrY
VVALAKSSQDALRAVKALRPDLALFDLNMGRLNGIDVTRSLLAERAPVAIVLVRADSDPTFAEAALTSGAGAFVLKSRFSEDLPAAGECALRHTFPWRARQTHCPTTIVKSASSITLSSPCG